MKENEFNTLASKLYISKLEAYSNGFKKSLIVDKKSLPTKRSRKRTSSYGLSVNMRTSAVRCKVKAYGQ
jgi:hypothetical protein